MLFNLVYNYRFYVDNVPIRVFKNNKNIGVDYPSQPMHIEASLWDGDSWATDGGQTKINWTHAPFNAHYQGFGIAGCLVQNSLDIQQCYSSKYWWNLEKYWKLDHRQQREYENLHTQSARPKSSLDGPSSKKDSLNPSHTLLPNLLLHNLRRLRIGFFPRRIIGRVASETTARSESIGALPLRNHSSSALHLPWPPPPPLSQSHCPTLLLGQVQKFHVKEMELSFTQGRWNYDRWGGFDPISSSNAKPPGVELWAVFDVPKDQSLLQLILLMNGAFTPSSGSLRYGTLPREAVCTENLTPWLKLLPCRDKAGLSALLDRPSIYRGFYHSQRLHLTSSEFHSSGVESGIVLEQALTVVLQPNSHKTSKTFSSETKLQPSWSLSSIFGRKVTGRCVLAKTSNVYLQLERGLVTELENLQKDNTITGPDHVGSEGLKDNPGFELSVRPDKMFKEVNSLHRKSLSVLYEYSIERYSVFEPFDLGLTWKFPVVWSCPRAPLHSSRFLMGSGNQRGTIAISFISTDLEEGFLSANIGEESCKLQADIFQVVPWHIKVYYHTLLVFVVGQLQPITNVVEKMHVSPSEGKVSPGVMELVLKFPCAVKSAALTLEFDKGFLHIDEYPPDANQGFDIPSAVIIFPNFQTSMHYLEDNFSNKSPMLSKFQEKSPVLSYTEVLLVPLTTPDFSMPYNVITITCTVFALYFGSLLNVLRRRVGEEERILKNRASKKAGRLPQLLSRLSAKLRGKEWEPPQSHSTSSSIISSKLILKVLIVAGVAVFWQYYSK
nr:gpi transamidase component pig-t [Quercus suber]